MVGGTTRLLVWASTGPESSSTTSPAQRPPATARPTFRMASLPVLPATAGYTPVGFPGGAHLPRGVHIERPGPFRFARGGEAARVPFLVGGAGRPGRLHRGDPPPRDPADSGSARRRPRPGRFGLGWGAAR